MKLIFNHVGAARRATMAPLRKLIDKAGAVPVPAVLTSLFLLTVPGLFSVTTFVSRESEIKSHREIVDVNAYPWSSIGKIGNSAGGQCTASVIGVNQVLTAAHCLYNKRAGRFIAAGSIHFLLGYTREQYKVHGIASKYTIPPGFNPTITDGMDTAFAHDWAILYLVSHSPQT